MKIGQYLTKLCVDYVGLLFWPTLYIKTRLSVLEKILYPSGYWVTFYFPGKQPLYWTNRQTDVLTDGLQRVTGPHAMEVSQIISSRSYRLSSVFDSDSWSGGKIYV